ncbi:ventrally expressed dharma/bozozok antagonist [Vanacampus margaritifer]
MRGPFSIEWMAQSSRQLPAVSASASVSVSGARLVAPGLAGTHAESLPGFYRRSHNRGGGAPAKRPKMDAHDDKMDAHDDKMDAHHDKMDAHHDKMDAHHDKMDAHDECTKMPSEAEEETSGYESERSLSPPAAANAASSSPPAGRRPRTAFTAEQIGSLERAFKRNAYLGTQDKAQLCRKLNLSDKQIRNWFQNRRMKLKRTVQDALAHACQAGAASHFAPYPEMQAYRPAPYPRYHPVPPALQDAVAAAAAAALAHPPHNLQYASPLDSHYQYGAMLPAAAPPPPLMGAYPAYPKYY